MPDSSATTDTAATTELKSITAVLRERAALAPSRVAITCAGRSVSRQELEENSNRLAQVYESMGVSYGDTVTIALPNGIEFFEAVIAVWKLGAVPQPVSCLLPLVERAAIIELADPVLIVGVDDSAHPERLCLPAGYEADPSLSAASVEPERPSPCWKIMASGGSTGLPKLIMSGDGASELAANAGLGLGMREDGVVLAAGPLHHNTGFSLSWGALFLGCHVVVLPHFEAPAALTAIEEHRVEWTALVPTMMSRMLRAMMAEPARFDLSSLTTLAHVAAACPHWVKEGWMEILGPDNVLEIYGGTESQALTLIRGSEWLEHRGSVGRPLVGEMRILGPDGEDLPPGEVGEIFMRPTPGSRPTYRYIGATARERDGWESLGDLGWMDSDGYVYISDRRVDMIVTGGANVYPAEVEAVLDEHPRVLSAIVVGLPDEDLGQRVHAVVQPEGEVTAEELTGFLQERLVRYKLPRSYRFVDGALRDDAGKARRSAIRDAECARLNSSAVSTAKSS